jgi:hypothetical protein
VKPINNTPCSVCRRLGAVPVKCEGLTVVVCGECCVNTFAINEAIRRAKEAAK